MDEVATMRRVTELTGDVVDQVGADQLDLPTPCVGWTVRDVLNHITAGAEMLAVGVRDGSIPDDELGRIMTTDRLGDDHRRAFHRAADDANAVLAVPGVLHRIVQLPFGEMPASMAVRFAIFDFTTHAWDLATATGQSTQLDPEVAGVAHRMAQTMLSDDLRAAGMFGPEVAAPVGAHAADRLAALTGRTP